MSELDGLVDIEILEIDTKLPKEERIKEYVRQIVNPYSFKYKDLRLSISFCGDVTLENVILNYIKNK